MAALALLSMVTLGCQDPGAGVDAGPSVATRWAAARALWHIDRDPAALGGFERAITLDLTSLAEVDALADSLVLLEAGRVVAAGPVEALSVRTDLPALSSRRDAGALLSAWKL